MGRSAAIEGMYHAMLDTLGPSGWWPGDTPFEIAVGAILTQNTNWGNVEKAMGALKARSLLSARAMHALDPAELAQLIRPAGCYNVKAVRLRRFLDFLKDEADFEMDSLKVHAVDELRAKLLAISGIGPETADSILLYALEMQTFVVDAYTYRMLRRHGLVHEGIDYHEMQALFVDALPVDVAVYKEYHALIVRTGKEWCRKKAGLCEACPLQTFLQD